MIKLRLPKDLHGARHYVFGGVAGILIAILAFFWYQGGNPAAIVNGEAITVRRLALNFNAATSYYANAQKAYQAEGQKALDKGELRAEVMTRLIESELIEAGLKAETGDEADYLMASKLSRYENHEELEKAATTAYGISYEDFWNEVIVPQAKRDILAGRLFLRGVKMDEWLAQAKRDASVILFAEGLKWNGAYAEIEE